MRIVTLRGQPTVLTWTRYIDYQIWWKLQQRVYRSRIHDVDQLKSRLIEGNISTRCSSMSDQAVHGVHVFELAFEHTEDILNTDFLCLILTYTLKVVYTLRLPIVDSFILELPH